MQGLDTARRIDGRGRKENYARYQKDRGTVEMITNLSRLATKTRYLLSVLAGCALNRDNDPGSFQLELRLRDRPDRQIAIHWKYQRETIEGGERTISERSTHRRKRARGDGSTVSRGLDKRAEQE